MQPFFFGKRALAVMLAKAGIYYAGNGACSVIPVFCAML